MLAPVVEKVAQAYTGRIRFVKLDTDRSPGLAGEYHVSGNRPSTPSESRIPLISGVVAMRANRSAHV
jgi:hypothetical protein